MLIAIIALSATERKDTTYIVNCDTVMVVRTLKDTTITTVVKEDTLKVKKPKAVKSKNKKKK